MDLRNLSELMEIKYLLKGINTMEDTAATELMEIKYLLKQCIVNSMATIVLKDFYTDESIVVKKNHIVMIKKGTAKNMYLEEVECTVLHLINGEKVKIKETLEEISSYFNYFVI
jgi:uncharacterized linocin/CFP29 family protein